MIKKILLAVAVMLPLFGASAQNIKIGLVNTNEIIQAMPETADAQKKLAENSKKYEDEYARPSVRPPSARRSRTPWSR